MDFLKDQPYLLLPIIATVLLVIFLLITLFKGNKSSFTFNENISGGVITDQQPKIFPLFTNNNGDVPKVPAGTKQYWDYEYSEYTEFPKGENQSIPLLPATIKE